MGTTANYGWEYPDDGADQDVWGAIHTTMVEDIDATLKAQVDALSVLISANTPSGVMLNYPFAVTPAGFIQFDGSTVGNASSNATGRANADTQSIFINLWNQYDNTACPIRDSAGSLTMRGASAGADFAANKALGTIDLRGYFLRVWDNGRGIDTGRGFGTFQTDQNLAHTHTFSIGNDPLGSVAADGSGFTGTATTASSGGPEARPKNFATYVIVKL